MRSLPDTFTHDQQWESNPRPPDLGVLIHLATGYIIKQHTDPIMVSMLNICGIMCSLLKCCFQVMGNMMLSRKGTCLSKPATSIYKVMKCKYYVLLKGPWGDKVSMVAHTCPHKSLGRLKRLRNMPSPDWHTLCGMMSYLVICKHHLSFILDIVHTLLKVIVIFVSLYNSDLFWNHKVECK